MRKFNNKRFRTTAAPTSLFARFVGGVTSSSFALLLSLGILAFGYALSLISLFAIRRPYLGWSDEVVAVAKARALGFPQYGSPILRWTSLFYPPAYTEIFGILLRVYWWEGWGVLLSVSSVLFSTIAAEKLVRSFYGSSGKTSSWERWAVVTLIALGSFNVFSPNGIMEARTDQMSSCFFLWGLALCLPSTPGIASDGRNRSLRESAVSGLFFMAALWTKQLLLPVILSAFVLQAVLIKQKRLKCSATVVNFAMFLGPSLFLLAAYHYESEGWSTFYLFRAFANHARLIDIQQSMRLVALAISPLLLILFCSILIRIGARARLTRIPEALFIAAVSFIAASQAITKQGGDTNSFALVVWMVAIIATIGILEIKTVIGDKAIKVFCAWLVSATLLSGAPMMLGNLEVRFGLDLFQPVEFTSFPSEHLMILRTGQTVWDPSFPSLTFEMGSRVVGAVNATPDLSAAGVTPRWFLRQLAESKYDRVALYNETWATYASAFGKFDERFLFTVNDLIRSRYESTESSPLLVRRSVHLGGADPLQCFGPFTSSVVQLELRKGLGLACREGFGLAVNLGESQHRTVALRQNGRGSVLISGAQNVHWSDISIIHNGRTECVITNGSGSIIFLSEGKAKLSCGSDRDKTIALEDGRLAVDFRSSGSLSVRASDGRTVKLKFGVRSFR